MVLETDYMLIANINGSWTDYMLIANIDGSWNWLHVES